MLTYNPAEGAFTEVQYISTIPAAFDENNQGSAIHISSDGQFVYAGNRGHNSIAVFSVDQNSGEPYICGTHIYRRKLAKRLCIGSY